MICLLADESGKGMYKRLTRRLRAASSISCGLLVAPINSSLSSGLVVAPSCNNSHYHNCCVIAYCKPVGQGTLS
jgi:hypothetical protein